MTGTTYTPAQKALIEKHREINVDYDWWSRDIIASCCDLMNYALGFDVHTEDVRFSGFWSQGDGASFTFISDLLSRMVEKATAWLEANPEPEGGETAHLRKEVRAMATWLRDTFDRFRLGGDNVWHGVLGKIYIRARRTDHQYAHSGTVTASWDASETNVDVAIQLGLIGDNGEMVGDNAKLLNDNEIDKKIEALADALYRELQKEHEFLTSDEQVWEAIVANYLDEGDSNGDQT